MKKLAIAAVLLLSTGLTALSITRNSEKPVWKSSLAEKTEGVTSNTVLATAD